MTDEERKALAQEIAYESYNWHDGGPVVILAQILEGLPGGDDLEGLFEPLGLGWREVSLLAEWLTKIDTADDVEEVAKAILHPDEYLD